MTRNDLDQAVAAAVAEAAETIGGGPPPPTRLHHALTVLAQRVEAAARDYELSNLRTVDDLAAEFGVSVQRIRALAAARHAQFGVGMKFGRSWLWSVSEIDAMRPALTAGRPRKQPTVTHTGEPLAAAPARSDSRRRAADRLQR